jgi:hypothetical protein
MTIQLNTTNEMRLNMFRANFNHNAMVMKELMVNMIDDTIGNMKFTHRTLGAENSDLDLLWNMLLEEINKINAENHKVTKEVRAIFRTRTGITDKGFFSFIVNDDAFDMLKYIPGAVDAFVDCCLTLNEHYESFAKRVEKFTNDSVSLINIANCAYEMRNFSPTLYKLKNV